MASDFVKCKTKWCRNSRSKKDTVCPKCRARAYKINYPGHKQYYDKKAHAKMKGIAFTLTRAEFLEVWQPGMTIDRRDGLKGYHRDNIQAMSLAMNSSKGTIDKQRRYEPDPECGF